jgi:hypothetical protein
LAPYAPGGPETFSLRNEVVPALFWGKAGWRVSASWKIILISQGVKRKRSQPATTSSRCREVHIFFCGEATKAALGRSSTRALRQFWYDGGPDKSGRARDKDLSAGILGNFVVGKGEGRSKAAVEACPRTAARSSF